MRRRVPDNTRSGELVGFVPTTPLDEMIAAIAADLGADAQPDALAAIQAQRAPDVRHRRLRDRRAARPATW